MKKPIIAMLLAAAILFSTTPAFAHGTPDISDKTPAEVVRRLIKKPRCRHVPGWFLVVWRIENKR